MKFHLCLTILMIKTFKLYKYFLIMLFNIYPILMLFSKYYFKFFNHKFNL